MANGEWLTQLLSGLGGAFTGEVAARGRLAEEQEYKRRQDEAARQREQERQLGELRRGLLQSFSPERARQAAAAGLSLSDVAAISRLNEPEKMEPKYEERREGGGVAIYEDGRFKSWKIRPPSEREPGTSPADIRGAMTDLRGAEQLFSSTMRQKPRAAQFPGEMNVGTDTAAFNRAMEGWKADSTYAAQRRQAAGEEVSRLTGRNPLVSAPARTAMVPNAAEQNRIVNEAQSAIRQIMASAVSDAEKASLVQKVNARLRTALSNLNP